MHTDTKNRILISLLILGICSIPIQTVSITTEENPDDTAAMQLSQTSPVVLTIPNVPSNTTVIALWTGDTVRAADTTPLEIQTGNSPSIQTTLGKILQNNREIVLPINSTFSGPLQIKISAPTLDAKKSIMLRTQQKDPTALAYTLFARKPLLWALIHNLYEQKAIANDIEYVWNEGSEIIHGNNPYARAATDTKHGGKYATYFPLSYIASAAIQKMGFTSFDSWMNVVRPIVLFSQLFSAGLVLYYLANKRLLALGLFAFFSILFHRFVLYPARVTHIDFPAIAFLLLGLILLSKKPKTAYVLLGISLAIKQMAIFLLPAILIYTWHTHKSKKQLMLACIYICIVPIATLVPFIINSPSGVMNSIVFSANRSATGDFASPDIATTLSLTGIAARIPMLFMIALIYIAVWRKEIQIYGATLAIFIIFIGFNPVLFFQYLAWIIPFIPLAISEATLSGSPLQSSRQSHDT